MTGDLQTNARQIFPFAQRPVSKDFDIRYPNGGTTCRKKVFLEEVWEFGTELVVQALILLPL